ncbi:hypothetical protein [Herminiimonas sp. CN]|uniref:hypothetical protein n=1 Tax=Herminiimonas sp. CN TaxID=1349818 RepID=UPI0012DCB8A0|nr:hypothetical protein [Herminiimonas sp. CN]
MKRTPALHMRGGISKGAGRLACSCGAMGGDLAARDRQSRFLRQGIGGAEVVRLLKLQRAGCDDNYLFGAAVIASVSRRNDQQYIGGWSTPFNRLARIFMPGCAHLL